MMQEIDLPFLVINNKNHSLIAPFSSKLVRQHVDFSIVELPSDRNREISDAGIIVQPDGPGYEPI